MGNSCHNTKNDEYKDGDHNRRYYMHRLSSIVNELSKVKRVLKACRKANEMLRIQNEELKSKLAKQDAKK